MKKAEVLSLPDGLYNAAPNLYLHVQQFPVLGYNLPVEAIDVSGHS